MRNKCLKLILPLSVMLMFTLIFGSASHAFAEPPAHAETVHITGRMLPWGIDRIDAELVYPSNKGTGVKVAVLDTGIDLDHPDLRVAGDVTFVPNTTSGDDDNGHGTMVAGIIAALDNDIGVVGVAPEVELYSVKVIDKDGVGRVSAVLSGIEWAVNNNMQVINMSFGSSMNMTSSIIAALDNAYKAGIVIVAAAGNEGDASGEGNNIDAPARYAPVIAVGATDKLDNRYSSSSTGNTLEVMAPGVNIPSTTMGGGYGRLSRTSASSPHVAGVAALLIASGVTSNVEVRQRLQETTEDLGPSGQDRWYGYGLVNAAEAVGVASPPTTRIEFSGLLGNEGWYCSDVTVELTAEDNTGGSGVAEIQYSLDNGKTWQSYHEPFTLAHEGINIIQARSRDNTGNLEDPPVSRQVKIDKTPPQISIVSPEAKTYPSSETISIDFSVVDDTSGVQSVNQRKLDGTLLADGQGIRLCLVIESMDIAGNTSTASVTFIIGSSCPEGQKKGGS